MPLNVFILGRPGSGKSSIARYIYLALERIGWSVEHLYDYKLLQERFLQEINDGNIPLPRRQFEPRGPEAMRGFDVLDPTVLDTVLKELAASATSLSKSHSSHEYSLLLIEFARKDYLKSLSLFDHGLLQNAHIVYIESSFEDCMERIDQRVDSRSQYDHYVSNDTMRRYYSTDDWLDGRCQQHLKDLERSGVHTYRHHINNKGSQEALLQEVDGFMKMHLLQETEANSFVQETEPIPTISKVKPQTQPKSSK